MGAMRKAPVVLPLALAVQVGSPTDAGQRTHRSGRTKEALDAYRALHALLDAELGVAPIGELRLLHQAVLSRDPAIAVARRDRRTPAPVFG
ncbi:BTAD domain-containing putative transcriptional regulator [Streptomyces sp. NPDC048441]|uniref:BTAD domain-containing putative transcriptional regulator n=1 Tax=Streptomyces sp. NPDC048441 TaxID=3365552 RepID=UPI00372004F1